MKLLKNKKGFTLIELLIVMIILGMLAALVGPRMFGKVDKSKQKAAKAQISLLETALDTYRLDMGHYPTTDQGLTAMRIKPEGEENWDGPYLPKEVPLDPWGNPYEYKAPGPQGDFEIISYGADGEPGGDDKNMDIYNWKSLG